MSKDIDIDMVFTYVNGYDPEFIKLKNSYINDVNKRYNSDIRSKGLDEIIYSVNSVIKFIPWIRKIFIVTNNQIPPIDKQLISSGKVIIIDQNTIVESKYLPTFNSDVIESYLHNIPDLSEIFLYNNDDMMHLNNIDKQDIYDFKDNNIRLKIRNNYYYNNKSAPPNKNYGEYFQRIQFTRNLFLKVDPKRRLINNHHTKFLRKSTMKYIENPWAIQIIDDCTDNPAQLRDPVFQAYYKNGRHWRMIHILSLQYCLDILPSIRTNIDYTFILRETNQKNRKALYENYAGNIETFAQFNELMDVLTEDYTALVINNRSKTNKLEDCVFWYKADPSKIPGNWKFGHPTFWEYNLERNNDNFSDPLFS